MASARGFVLAFRSADEFCGNDGNGEWGGCFECLVSAWFTRVAVGYEVTRRLRWS